MSIIQIARAVIKSIKPKKFTKKGLSIGMLKTLVVGIILLVVLISVYTTYAANFTGITGVVMGFLTVGAAVGLFIKSFA